MRETTLRGRCWSEEEKEKGTEEGVEEGMEEGTEEGMEGGGKEDTAGVIGGIGGIDAEVNGGVALVIAAEITVEPACGPVGGLGVEVVAGRIEGDVTVEVAAIAVTGETGVTEVVGGERTLVNKVYRDWTMLV